MFSGDLVAESNTNIQTDLVVNGGYGLAVGVLSGSALRLATGNTWESGELRFSGVMIGDGSQITNIGESAILDLAMNTLKFVDNAVINATFADRAVNLVHITPGSVGLNKFNVGGIDTDDLSNGVINSTHIRDGEVDASMIEVGAIGTLNIPAGWVTREKVATGAVINSKLADLSIGTVQLADGAVSGNHFVSGAIAEEHLAIGAVSLGSVATQSIDSGLLGFVMSVAQGGTGRSAWDNGAIPVLDGAGNVFISDSNLVISNDRLGIGVSSPNYSIHVRNFGPAGVRSRVQNGDALGIQFDRPGTSWRMQMDGNGGVQWIRNAAIDPAMVLTSTGRLGVGVTLPQERLAVDGAVVLLIHF